MNLIGQPVKHKIFGSGIITEADDNTVTVCFSQGDKKFIYPDAFSQFLVLKNTSLQAEISAIRHLQIKKETAKFKKIEKEIAKTHKINNMKVTPVSHAAFDIKPADMGSAMDACEISAGQYLSGASKGEPRIPIRMQPNTACACTYMKSAGDEKSRIIAGVFMVSDTFFGRECTDGIIKIHPSYRIILPENLRPYYYDYFGADDRQPPKSWGKVPFKYLENTLMQQILKDCTVIMQAARNREQEKAPDSMNNMYEYFCRLNSMLDITPSDEIDKLGTA